MHSASCMPPHLSTSATRVVHLLQVTCLQGHIIIPVGAVVPMDLDIRMLMCTHHHSKIRVFCVHLWRSQVICCRLWLVSWMLGAVSLLQGFNTQLCSLPNTQRSFALFLIKPTLRIISLTKLLTLQFSLLIKVKMSASRLSSQDRRSSFFRHRVLLSLGRS
jgi:hypothetical protein